MSSPSDSAPIPGLDRRHFLCATALATGAMFSACSAQTSGQKSVWRVAVIGHTGHGNYGHDIDTLWLKVPNCQVVAFADADEAGRKKEQNKFPEAKAYSDYKAMLEEVKPDIVAVCPRELAEHHDMILAAVASGAKGVYCEKPFCRTPAEADEIVEACKKNHCRLAIAHRNRFHPVLPVVKEAIEKGAIGELLEIRGRGKEDQRGGALDLWVLGSHVIDLGRFFAGNAVACSSIIQKGNRLAVPEDLEEGGEAVGLIAGDQLHARFDMENGLPFYFDSIRKRGTGPAAFGLQLIGNAGVIDLRIDKEPLAHYVKGNPFQPTRTAREWSPISTGGIGVPEPIAGLGQQVAQHQRAALDLIAAIEEDRPTLCSEEDGRAIVEMVHAVFASHVANGARVSLPLESRQHAFQNWKPAESSGR